MIKKLKNLYQVSGARIARVFRSFTHTYEYEYLAGTFKANLIKKTSLSYCS